MTLVENDIDPLALERQVCFALAVTNRAVLAVYRPLLEPLGLTHPQYLVMLALWDNAKGAGEPLSVKDIARLLQMDSNHTLANAQTAAGPRPDHPRGTRSEGPQSAAAGAGGYTVGRRAPRRRALRTRA